MVNIHSATSWIRADTCIDHSTCFIVLLLSLSYMTLIARQNTVIVIWYAWWITYACAYTSFSFYIAASYDTSTWYMNWKDYRQENAQWTVLVLIQFGWPCTTHEKEVLILIVVPCISFHPAAPPLQQLLRDTTSSWTTRPTAQHFSTISCCWASRLNKQQMVFTSKSNLTSTCLRMPTTPKRLLQPAISYLPSLIPNEHEPLLRIVGQSLTLDDNRVYILQQRIVGWRSYDEKVIVFQGTCHWDAATLKTVEVKKWKLSWHLCLCMYWKRHLAHVHSSGNNSNPVKLHLHPASPRKPPVPCHHSDTRQHIVHNHPCNTNQSQLLQSSSSSMHKSKG